jgi:hypothetical protein
MAKQQCTLCDRPSVPGLIRGAGKCQHHYNVGQFGRDHADLIAATSVQTVYRVRVSFYADDIDSVSDGLLGLGRKLDRCEVYTGGPACFPYVTAEDGSYEAVKQFAEKAVRYVRRRKGGRVNP